MSEPRAWRDSAPPFKGAAFELREQYRDFAGGTEYRLVARDFSGGNWSIIMDKREVKS